MIDGADNDLVLAWCSGGLYPCDALTVPVKDPVRLMVS